MMPLDAGLGAEPHIADAHLGREIYQGLALVDTLRRHLAGVGGECQARSCFRWRKSPIVSEPLRLPSGSIRKRGDQFEVKLRVFLAGSDSPAWAETFMGSSTRLGRPLRRATSLSIARAMKVNVPYAHSHAAGPTGRGQR